MPASLLHEAYGLLLGLTAAVCIDRGAPERRASSGYRDGEVLHRRRLLKDDG